VRYGGKDFSQLDIRFKEDRQEKYARLLVTCAPQVYVIFQLIGYTAADVDGLSQVPNSIQFSGS